MLLDTSFLPEGFENLSLDQVAALLTDDTILAILEHDEEEQWSAKYEMFKNIFPAKTFKVGDFAAWSRFLYPKHMKFFELGADIRFRCFMAANRCLGPWTYLETPDGEALSAEVWTSTDARVLSWVDGSRCAARSEGAYLKGIEPAYRLVTAQGRFVDCSSEHRLLTDEGWLSLDQLVSRASGLRLWQTRADYQANCEADGYLGDRPLQSVAGIDLAPPPSPCGVQTRNPLVFSPTDEVERTRRCILSDPTSDRLSTRDDLKRFAALFAHLSGPSSASPVVRLSAHSLALQRLALECGPRPEGVGSQIEEPGCQALASRPTQSLAAPCIPREMSDLLRSRRQSLCVQSLGSSVRELDCDAERTAMFLPSVHPSLVGGERIVAVVPLGLQPIVDAHVPPANNYLAAGIVNHNCGKTVSGAFEMTCHLTGLYPDWWEGKRFLHPIRAWACGKTNETTRDIVQLALLGEIAYHGSRKGVDGSGMVPIECIGADPGQLTWKQGVADLVDTVRIRHRSGGWSKLSLKSYQQGRGSFEGTAMHFIWDDEQPPLDVYSEQVMRLATTKGALILTFTPMEGRGEVVEMFMADDHDVLAA